MLLNVRRHVRSAARRCNTVAKTIQVCNNFLWKTAGRTVPQPVPYWYGTAGQYGTEFGITLFSIISISVPYPYSMRYGTEVGTAWRYLLLGTLTSNTSCLLAFGIDCHAQKPHCRVSQLQSIMSEACPLTCGLCNSGVCRDAMARCSPLKHLCRDYSYRAYMTSNCARTCGLCMETQGSGGALTHGKSCPAYC